MKKYKKAVEQTTPEQGPIRSILDQLVVNGAQRMVQEALEAELTEYLGRARYERHEPGTDSQYRNGHGKPRQLGVGCGTISVRTPRLREAFESSIVGHYRRMSPAVASLLPELYMHGLSTGDFQSCFSAFLGDGASLSSSSIVRMKEQWEQDYQHWKKRDLDREYLYVWVDGVYPKAGPKDEKMAVLVVVGVNRQGQKELLAIEEGYRESAESWRDVFRDLKRRGLRWIGLVIGDGIGGLWKALRDVYPVARQQRCWVHKMRNVVDKVPQQAHDDVLQALREIYAAPSKDRALGLLKAFRLTYGQRYPKAVASLDEAGELLFSYFAFPRRHWISLKSTNVIESLFSAVKLRTDAARRIPRRESALYLVYKLLMHQQQRLHRIHGYKFVAQTIELMQLKRNARLRIAA
jgi:putative transposase